jgi:hypothetical protein
MIVQFVEVSGHNLESFQTLGFRIQCLPYKQVSNHSCSRGAGGGVNQLVKMTLNSKEENS